VEATIVATERVAVTADPFWGRLQAHSRVTQIKMAKILAGFFIGTPKSSFIR
jgi:hypothetical protein